jgi:hypothetical protein
MADFYDFFLFSTSKFEFFSFQVEHEADHLSTEDNELIFEG